jgi:prepilin-type N-terminal cleavage/methylation domain-containing protein
MRRARGITLVEFVVVIAVIAILAFALYPLVKTTFDSWVTADRRGEVVMTGRVGMHKLTQEIRRAYDLWSATDATYIDYFPGTATSTQWRFKYSAAAYNIYWSATSTFTSDSLAAPIDSFLYKTYTRRLQSNVTRARQVNSIFFLFSVSDERQKLATPVVPMFFRSFVNVRNSREGYVLAKSIAFSSESYFYTVKNGDQFCVRTYCDRTNPVAVATAMVTMSWTGNQRATMSLTYFANGDYYATCCTLNKVAGTRCFQKQDNAAGVEIQLSDATETCIMQERVRVKN